MLDPSSSEDTGGESDTEARETPRKPAAGPAGRRGNDSGKSSSSSGGGGGSGSRAAGGGGRRQSAAPGGAAPGKDSHAPGEEQEQQEPEQEEEEEERKERERVQKEEEDRRMNLQIYVLVLRCVAYPFNAKQPTDMARRQQKVNKQQLQSVKERFLAFLNGETQIVADEAFCNAVRSYYEGQRMDVKSHSGRFTLHQSIGPKHRCALTSCFTGPIGR